jgi:hypothetical protein
MFKLQKILRVFPGSLRADDDFGRTLRSFKRHYKKGPFRIPEGLPVVSGQDFLAGQTLKLAIHFIAIKF